MEATSNRFKYWATMRNFDKDLTVFHDGKILYTKRKNPSSPEKSPIRADPHKDPTNRKGTEAAYILRLNAKFASDRCLDEDVRKAGVTILSLLGNPDSIVVSRKLRGAIHTLATSESYKKASLSEADKEDEVQPGGPQHRGAEPQDPPGAVKGLLSAKPAGSA